MTDEKLEYLEEEELKSIGEWLSMLGSKINFKVIAIIILIVVAIVGVSLWNMYGFMEKTKECRELVGIEEVNYEEKRGNEECCFIYNEEYTCYELETLRNQDQIIHIP
jgi:hypothetical protein